MELPPLWREWEIDLDLADDLTATEWLLTALRPWEWADGGAVWVASFVPDRYERHARIPHRDHGDNRPAGADTVALGTALRPFTSTPQHCVFCFWTGHGFWDGPGASGRAELARIPLLELENREHFVFTGPLERTARPFVFGTLWEQPPNIWWPDDRAWFVATEVDASSTYAGGSAACIDALLADPALGAVAAVADEPIQGDGSA